MTSYVKRRNCCILQKSKKYFESIRQNVNEFIDVVNELTIKGEFCEFKAGDLSRLLGMRNQVGQVIRGWCLYNKRKITSEVITVNTVHGVQSEGTPKGLGFEVALYTVGERLEARAVKMFSLTDVVGHAFAIAENSTEFADEYDSNPDILLEDVSEFLQAIDKLENIMKQVSIDNRDLDPDTQFCCTGEPPKGKKPNCE